jgi:hypothetical protein
VAAIMSPSGIGGPGGIDGPKGPGGVGGPDAVDDVDGADGADAADAVDGAAAATADDQAIAALAAELRAGTITPEAALDRLLDQTVSADLDPAERAELREMIVDLVANDPYLSGLLGSIR